MSRPTIELLAINIAKEMATRSEDPWNKVGAVALTSDNRIIATAYNGLLPGVELHHLFQFLDCANSEQNREARLPFMVHAEQNLCSLIKRGEAQWCVTTLCPCPSCLLLLVCHGIRRIIYLQEYERDNRAHEIAKFYNIELCHLQ